MKSNDLRRQVMSFAACACIVALALAPACSPGADGRDGPAAEAAYGPAQECEDALRQLDALIEARIASGDESSPEIVEARELRAQATELYLNGDYDLATELITEALALLRTQQP